MVTGEFDGSEHVLGRAVLGAGDDGLVSRLLHTAGAVLRVGAVEFGVLLDDVLGLPFRGVLLRIEQRTRSRVGDLLVLALVGRGRGCTGRFTGACRSGDVAPGVRIRVVGSAAVGSSARVVGGAGVDDGTAACRGLLVSAGEVFEALLLLVGQTLVTAAAVLVGLLLVDLLLGAGVADEGDAAEHELSGRADEVAGLLVRVAGQVDDDVAVTLRRDLGFGDTG